MDGNRCPFVAEYITAAEEARKAAREAGAGSGAGAGVWSPRDPQGGERREQGATQAERQVAAGRGGRTGRAAWGTPGVREGYGGRPPWSGGPGPTAGSRWSAGGEGDRQHLAAGRGLMRGSGGQPAAASPIQEADYRARSATEAFRTTMAELEETYGTPLRDLSRSVAERFEALDARMGAQERKTESVEARLANIETGIRDLGTSVRDTLSQVDSRLNAAGGQWDHTQDLVNSLLQEVEQREEGDSGRKRPHTTGGKGGRDT